jgi:ankyrin repeat protein
LLDPRRNNPRFSFGRQSSQDQIRRSPCQDAAGLELSVPKNLDATMQLLLMACKGEAKGVEDLLNKGIDVNSIDLDGRTALHIAAYEGHVKVVKLLLSRKVNMTTSMLMIAGGHGTVLPAPPFVFLKYSYSYPSMYFSG